MFKIRNSYNDTLLQIHLPEKFGRQKCLQLFQTATVKDGARIYNCLNMGITAHTFRQSSLLHLFVHTRGEELLCKEWEKKRV